MKLIKIFGVAGAGKTTECTSIVMELVGLKKRRELLEDLPPYSCDDICFSSFTTAALESILQKLSQRDVQLPENHSFRTLHSLTWRMSSYGGSEMKASDRNDYFKRVGIKTQRENDGVKSEAEQIEWFYETLINRLAKPLQNINRAEMNSVFQDMQMHESDDTLDFLNLHDNVVRYHRWKEVAGKHVYVDSLLNAFHNRLPLQKKVLIIDECQDLNYLQTELVKFWGENVELLILAGDDDQTVHEWAGATPHFFIEYKKEVAEKIILDKSYRVPQNVAVLANDVLRRIRFRQEKTIQSSLPRQKIHLLREDYTLLGHIEAVSRKNNLLGDNTYVLCRTKRIRNRVSSSFFDFSDVPFDFLGDRGGYTRKFKELCNALNKLSMKESLLIGEVVRLFDCLPASICLKRGARKEVENSNQNEFTTEWVLSRTRLWCADLTRFFSTTGVETGQVASGRLKDSMLSYVRYSGRFLSSDKDVIGDDERMRSKLSRISKLVPYDEDVNIGLKFGTFHSAKGLEASDVFVCLGTNNYFRNIDDTELRCFYVAVTRTKGGLFFVAPSGGDAMWLADSVWGIVTRYSR